MSQSKLYTLFGIYGYSIMRTEVQERVLYTYVEPQDHRVCCSNCRSKEVIRRGSDGCIRCRLAEGRRTSLRRFLEWNVVNVESYARSS